MKKIVPLALIAAAAVVPVAANAEDTQTARVESAAAVTVDNGTMLYASNGYRLAPVYRVTSDGSPQIILNGKLVTVPAATLSTTDGKVMTSLTKRELGRAK